ncbi:MAG TPA: VOC family protein [Cyclobacteriaceae bacterium]|nr:VOC family protein [Cyclobacteriaceae bacterium]
MKKLFLSLVVSCLFGRIWAQDNNTFSVSFDHVALSVKDVDRSAKFYKDVLNLEEIDNRSKIPGIRWFLIGEGKELHLISIIKEEVTANKAVHFALKTPDIDRFVKKLESLGIPFSDWPGAPNKVTIRADGIKQIFFQDPDGYWIEVNSLEKVAGK